MPLFSPRFRLTVGTLVLRGKGGILSLYQEEAFATRLTSPDRPSVDVGFTDITGCQYRLTPVLSN